MSDFLVKNGLQVLGGSLNISGNTIQNYTEYANAAVVTSPTVTVPSNSNVVRYTLNTNAVVTLPASQPGPSNAVKNIVLVFTQDSTGGRTMTLAASGSDTIKYNNAVTQPAVASGANKITIFTCMKFDSTTAWLVSLSYIDA
jgi:hypothetical protein